MLACILLLQHHSIIVNLSLRKISQHHSRQIQKTKNSQKKAKTDLEKN
jgi:hypothetical protein